MPTNSGTVLVEPPVLALPLASVAVAVELPFPPVVLGSQAEARPPMTRTPAVTVPMSLQSRLFFCAGPAAHDG
jgi:hypothetical protein